MNPFRRQNSPKEGLEGNKLCLSGSVRINWTIRRAKSGGSRLDGSLRANFLLETPHSTSLSPINRQRPFLVGISRNLGNLGGMKFQVFGAKLKSLRGILLGSWQMRVEIIPRYSLYTIVGVAQFLHLMFSWIICFSTTIWIRVIQPQSFQPPCWIFQPPSWIFQPPSWIWVIRPHWTFHPQSFQIDCSWLVQSDFPHSQLNYMDFSSTWNILLA